MKERRTFRRNRIVVGAAFTPPAPRRAHEKRYGTIYMYRIFPTYLYIKITADDYYRGDFRSQIRILTNGNIIAPISQITKSLIIGLFS
jgi:hypothetical protein